jgi:hypothetical protein
MADLKTTFGSLDAIKAPTPKWAVYTFRITTVVTTAIAVWIAGTGLIHQQAKLEIVLALKSLDTIVYGISKLFGVAPKEEPQST